MINHQFLYFVHAYIDIIKLPHNLYYICFHIHD